MKKVMKLKEIGAQYDLDWGSASWQGISYRTIALISHFEKEADHIPVQLLLIDPYDKDCPPLGYEIDTPADSTGCSVLLADLEVLGRSIIISFDEISFNKEPEMGVSHLIDLSYKPWFGILPHEQGQLYQIGHISGDTGLIGILIQKDANRYLLHVPADSGSYFYPILIGRLYKLGRCIVIPMRQV